ncbi:MAG: hypothetical protein JWM09_585 [Francisellaceae bacterium]|nr:hypothetical protein [Francisellaceae bacterium]
MNSESNICQKNDFYPDEELNFIGNNEAILVDSKNEAWAQVELLLQLLKSL